MSNTRHLLSALALSLSMALSVAPAQAALPLSVNGQDMPSLAPVVEQVTPAVVNILVSGKKVTRQEIPEQFRFFFGPDMPDAQVQEQPFQALGSGVIIDAAKGYVITNHHVIDGADEIKVTLKDGRELKAKKIGEDQQSDIAVLQIKADNLTEIKLANSEQLRVGDFAIAIGNPFGLGQTVTSGIISALGRSGLNIENIENFIQTDAAINSGNSGGALVNLNGELIGINTAILGPNGGNIGIGFAIPSNMVRDLSEQILKYGEVRRGVLGIMGGELTSDLAKAFGTDKQQGAFVNQVMANSAADVAGIKPGDIIVKLNGKAVRSFGELRANIATMGAGKTVTLGVIRDGKEQDVQVTLKQADLSETKASVLHPALEGATLGNSEPGASVTGVVITQLEQRSAAAQAGLQKGDVIIGVNRTRINNLQELRTAMKNRGEIQALNIRRGNATLYLVLR
ncbi:MAG: DegQ family serine endoprotease [Gammaproteobacteria bacterium]|uniref:Serine protease DegQ n=1 Tax=Tolumonas osonensis TaxID=675874 RepID=A0A841GGP2_9GAMM|nr:DegQ family serine endoprotease [Tolumonas osonensis]MBB6056747.1 serine protease DegQ [Tolumonas osonensis]NCB59382.1 DegQ family serine endoprotease [Gammaproteobacteria bacterium]